MLPPPYPGMPTPPAPTWVFPSAEIISYVLLLLCLLHAWKRGPRAIAYLLGGVCFGVLLEYMEVTMYSYSYNPFLIMIGKYPINVPLCIGVGWGVIMYSARLFSDRLGLTLLALVALDTLIAINIDLSMDTIATRLHMWNWNWNDPHINTLTAQWFGVPYGNFVGWQTVVFCYSLFNRLFERTKLNAVIIVFLALVCSLLVLFTTEEFVFPFMNRVHLNSFYRFMGINVVLVTILVLSWRKRKVATGPMPVITWLVPGWFHLFFFACLWICGFYTQQPLMTAVACINLLLSVLLHYPRLYAKRS